MVEEAYHGCQREAATLLASFQNRLLGTVKKTISQGTVSALPVATSIEVQ